MEHRLLNIVLDMAVTGKDVFKQQLLDALREWGEMGLTKESDTNIPGRRRTKNGVEVAPVREQSGPDCNNRVSLLVVRYLCNAISKAKPRKNATEHIDLFSDDPGWFNALVSLRRPERVNQAAASTYIIVSSLLCPY